MLSSTKFMSLAILVLIAVESLSLRGVVGRCSSLVTRKFNFYSSNSLCALRDSDSETNDPQKRLIDDVGILVVRMLHYATSLHACPAKIDT